jgi:universal stress protein F
MFNTILAAVDVNDTEGASRLIQAALHLTRNEEAVLHVLNVVPDAGMAMVGSLLGPDQSRKAVEQAKSALESWAESAIPSEVDARLHVSKGSIYDRIIKVADELGVHAIVVGAHRPGLQDYLIGPNSARVARHANQSVFVIR